MLCLCGRTEFASDGSDWFMLETPDGLVGVIPSKPEALEYEPGTLWEEANSLADSIISSHSWVERTELPGSPVLALESSKVKCRSR